MEERYNPKIADEAQYIYCRERIIPRFAPYGGRCWGCKQNIYSVVERNGKKTGISVWEAASRHIVVCPHCGFDFYSFRAERMRREYEKSRKELYDNGRDEQFGTSDHGA